MAELDTPGRIALVGLGGFGRFCLESYAATHDLTVVAVADSSPDALSMVPVGMRRETDWRALIGDPSIEVIHLVTPPFVREPIATASLTAGTSVFCEKPPALSMRELDAMLALAQRNNLAFGVDYVMRFQPAYRFLAGLAGLVGAPRTLAFVNLAQRVPDGHWFWDETRSGGIFVEHGIHFFDTYAQVFGPAVTVRGARPTPRSVQATVEYAAGGQGTYLHEFAYPSAVESTTGIVGYEAGTVRLDGWIPTRLEGRVLASREAVRDLGRHCGVEIRIVTPDPVTFHAEFGDRQGSYRAAIVGGMRDVVRRHRDPSHALRVGPDDIRRSLQLALAAQEAAREGTTISIP